MKANFKLLALILALTLALSGCSIEFTTTGFGNDDSSSVSDVEDPPVEDSTIYIYVGFYVSRNCNVTFRDIALEVTGSAAAGSAGGAASAQAPAGPSLVEEAWTAVCGWIGI